MTREQIEHHCNNCFAHAADWLSLMSDERLFDLNKAISCGDPIEHFFDSSTADAALRCLAIPTLVHELWRRSEVDEMES